MVTYEEQKEPCGEAFWTAGLIWDDRHGFTESPHIIWLSSALPVM